MLRRLTLLPGVHAGFRAGVEATACAGQQRGIKLFEVFSKERREERARELKEDLQRGYFDDFREFRDQHGKIFQSRLIPAGSAPLFPSLNSILPDGSPVNLPLAKDDATLTLVAIAFRAGAQDLIEQWSVPFSEAFRANPGVKLVELALIESLASLVIMRVWPFRQLLLRSGASSQPRYHMPVQYLFHFGNAKAACKALGLTNRLTGYVYLVDGQGRVRWQGSGPPTEGELATFLAAAEQLAAGTGLGPRAPHQAQRRKA